MLHSKNKITYASKGKNKIKSNAGKPKSNYCDALVVGSGPGGAISACLLAENGIDTMLMEEGPYIPVKDKKDHSLQEMNQQFRNGGINAMLGKDKIAYVEGCCLGGASEVNAGLYHRLPEYKRQEWEEKYSLKGFTKKN